MLQGFFSLIFYYRFKMKGHTYEIRKNMRIFLLLMSV